jgi:hypothetical protein
MCYEIKRIVSEEESRRLGALRKNLPRKAQITRQSRQARDRKG